MRRSFSGFTSAATAALFAVFMLSACVEGPEGPAGPQGETGATGATGAAGADGADANSTCVDCHDADTRIKSRQIQWEASTHATGGNFERVSSRGDNVCATCHTHEGFIERMDTGDWTTVEEVTNPTPPNCRTCHAIHDTYTEADLDVQFTTAFDLQIDGTTVDFGDGTLCANCHQPRTPGPPVVVGGGDVTITSAYWGVHHGPQGGILAGAGGYEFTGLTYPTAPHIHGAVATNPDGCVTCHMANPYGDQAGGHTMFMAYQYHGSDEPNLAGCATAGCHANTADWETLGYLGFDYKNFQTAVLADLAALKTKLLAVGIVTADDHAVPGTWTEVQAGALLNYLMVLEDRSNGVHNPSVSGYVSVLLKNTIAALP